MFTREMLAIHYILDLHSNVTVSSDLQQPARELLAASNIQNLEIIV